MVEITLILQLILPVIGGLLTLLVLLIGWIGNRIQTRLDGIGVSIDEKLGHIYVTLNTIEKDLRGELSGLDRRLTRLETECTIKKHE